VWKGIPLHCFVKSVQGEESKRVTGDFVRPVCEKSLEVTENKALLDARVWRCVRVVWLGREIAGCQISANAGRATDFTRESITRGGCLSILKCDRYSIRMSWQVVGPVGLTAGMRH